MGAFIQFIIKGTPKAQPRPRAWARKMANGQVVARVFNDSSAEGWKNCIATFANDHLPPAPLEGPIRVDVDFLFARPQRLLRKRDPDGEILHVDKPDRDNLDKALLDVLKVLGFFRDDSQVCAGEPRKFYVSRNGIPGARVLIQQIGIDNIKPAEVEMVSAPLFETTL